jgi:hypothetical protein
MTDKIRKEVVFQLEGGHAHASFDDALGNFPSEKRGVAPEGLPHSAWQQLEHIRIAQADMLEFCTNPNYKELTWPDDYWPKSSEPPNDSAWDSSIQQYKSDLKKFMALISDPKKDLTAAFPWGTGQTLFHEACLIIDHTSYHLGEIVFLRRLLKAWPPK